MYRASTLVLAAACLLSACGNWQTDPKPSSKTASDIAQTRMAVTKVEQTLTVEGCSVSVHRVHTSFADSLHNFTLAVADCPTATVTTTNQNCGKNCRQDAMLVQPKTAPQEGEAQAKRKAAAEAKITALREEAARLAGEVRRVEAELAEQNRAK